LWYSADNIGLTIKFDFNCILIDKDGIHKINLKSDDPIGDMKREGAAADVEAPNVPAEVTVAA
jgi:20S proteasome subunit beta 4